MDQSADWKNKAVDLGRRVIVEVQSATLWLLKATGRTILWLLGTLRLILGFVWQQLRCIPVLARLRDKVLAKLQPSIAGVHRHLEVWRIYWEEAKREAPIARPQGRELEFLPAVIEIQESPPSPHGRAIVYAIMGLFGLGLVWAVFGKIDIIAVAQGKIIPSDRSKVIQPLESGVIKAIHVRDGQRVKQGEPLIEIDTTAGADRERFTNEYLAALTEAARLRALLAGKNGFDPPKGADAAMVRTERKRLQDQLAELHALTSRAESYKKLLEKQFVSQMDYLEAERQRAQKAQEHAAALSAAETRALSLSQEIAKAETRAGQQHLSAPIDGVVQQLAVHTVGGVVTPAQQLMVVAPHEGQIEVEAFVENKDIGFVNENQQAEIKIEAFPFTRYGVIEGQVLTLSRDAVPIEKAGFFYSARVSVHQATIVVENGKVVPLTPGMNVSVEIKTGKRRLIEYFLSPLLQAAHDSVRER